MKINLMKGRHALEDDIASLERELGASLDSEFLDFVSRNDGAKPEPNTFKIGPTNNCGVNGFIPVKDIPAEMRLIDGFPEGSFPIAWAECGNYVFMSRADGGAVYFWNHELPEDTVKLASGFRMFLEMLEPLDVTSVKLEPGQVKYVWIDPTFRKELGDRED